MKIAQIVCAYPPYRGGIGKVASDITNELRESGHEVAVFTLRKKSFHYPDEVKALLAWPRLGNAGVLFGLFPVLADFDLIYLHYPFFGTAELVCLHRLLFRPKNKFLIHFHMDVSGLGFFQSLLAFPDKLLRQKLFSLADGITCASLDYVKDSSLAAVYEAQPERFHELPFLVDTEKFYPLLVVEKPEIPTILFVGGMDAPHHFKGVDILLRAFSELQTDARLRLVGDGSLRPGYETLAHQFGLSDRVEFLGALDDLALAKVYREADIFVLPSVSRHEAFGIVLLEAMASGLAVVASDLPGVRTVFRDGQEGLLFPPADSQALSRILEKLLTQSELRQTMSRKARELALARYDSRQQAERLDHLVRSL